MESVKLSWLGACVVIDTGDRVCAVDPADILAVYGANRGVTIYLSAGRCDPVHIGMPEPHSPAQVVRDLLAFLAEGAPDNGDEDVADIECAVRLRAELAVAEARGARLDVYIAKLEREELDNERRADALDARARTAEGNAADAHEWQRRARHAEARLSEISNVQYDAWGTARAELANAADKWRALAETADAQARKAETESARNHAAWTAERATLMAALAELAK